MVVNYTINDHFICDHGSPQRQMLVGFICELAPHRQRRAGGVTECVRERQIGGICGPIHERYGEYSCQSIAATGSDR